jgi:hypothetical protein
MKLVEDVIKGKGLNHHKILDIIWYMFSIFSVIFSLFYISLYISIKYKSYYFLMSRLVCGIGIPLGK